MTSAECRRLRFVSWNTCGVKDTYKSYQKFPKVLSRLSTLNADVVFIQETRVGPKCSYILSDVYNWKVYFTVHSSSSKGVAILIKKGVPFEYICHDEDCSGGYIVLFCYLHDELYTLVNVYNHKHDRVILPRLKEYLRETAEGVLVVGGDFNIVLHPGLDRKTLSSRHSPHRGVLEDFIFSLNLKDVWSYLYPAREGFTRHQKVKGKYSDSRLDMFFIQEDKIKRVCHSRVRKQDISDHYPIVLELKGQKKTEGKKTPNVASFLKDHKNNPDRRSGMISGAEILSVIKSLTHSGEHRTIDLEFYKKHCCPLTETLKIKYNIILSKSHKKKPELPEHFLGDRRSFNADYLIFSRILANRLSAFITPSFRQKTGEDFPIVFRLYFETGEQKIKRSFLLEALKKLKPIPSAPRPDFWSTLDCILPKVQGCSETMRLLPGCPLTNSIVNLALKHLKESIFEFKCTDMSHVSDKHHTPKCKEVMFRATVCYQRWVLCIHTQLTADARVQRKVNNLKEKVKGSGLKYTIFNNGD